MFGFATRPVVALIVFNAVLLFTHWPEVVDASVGSELRALLAARADRVVGDRDVVAGAVAAARAARRSHCRGRCSTCSSQSLAPTIPASFLTFGQTLLYPVYETFPRIWGISALTDQLIAGLIMKLVGGLILWGVIAVIFFNWAREERDGWDALALREVERDVRAGLAK